MRRRSRSEWTRLVGECARSSLTHAQFAARRGVHVATLRSWIYRLRRETPAEAEAPRLLPVRVIASAAPTARWQGDDAAALVELALPNGLRLRFASGTDAEYLAQLALRLG